MYHNLYVVYNLPDRDNIGANIYGLYLDPGKNPDNIRQTLDNAESIQAYIAGNRIVVHSACDIHIDLYSVNGTNMDRKDLPSGTNTLGQFAPGIYILKATGTDRNTTTLKLIVR
ncbi:MAG: T9SS type A sorting domain-containing protein [Paraprevotella clara]